MEGHLVELVAIWVDPELEEVAEVACCLLYFFIQLLLCQDSVSGVDQGQLNRCLTPTDRAT